MRIILLKDVEGIGKKHQIIDASPGYARNFLINKGLARAVAPSDDILSAKAEEKRKEEEEKEIIDTKKQAEEINGKSVEIKVKIGDKGQLFEAITGQKIAEALDLHKDQIILKEPIKEMGEFDVKVSFKHNIQAKVKVVIKEE